MFHRNLVNNKTLSLYNTEKTESPYFLCFAKNISINSALLVETFFLQSYVKTYIFVANIISQILCLVENTAMLPLGMQRNMKCSKKMILAMKYFSIFHLPQLINLELRFKCNQIY